MSNRTKHLFQSMNAHETEQFAERIGNKLRGNEVVELIGDVGAGKTTFVRGLAKGLGSVDHVSSPTFAIYNMYHGRFTMYHYDLYRLHNDELIKKELAERFEDPQTVLVLEWAGQLQEVLPQEHLAIEFKTTGESERSLTLAIPKSYNYLELP